MEKRRQPEIITGRVNADGTIAAGDGFTVQKTGTGSYTLAFTQGFRVLSCVTCLSVLTTFLAYPTAYTERTVAVSTFNDSTGALGDQPFSFVAVGVQT